MKNNREKIGKPGINWREAALGVGKNRRKTIGFGKYAKKEREHEDEFYVRELSIVDGGIGCAIWDAAIILTRWIYEYQEQSHQIQENLSERERNDLWGGKIVLELGSGVGLPGICAARFARQCFLTDYLVPVIENLRYNIQINSIHADEQLSFSSTVESNEEKSKRTRQQKMHVAQSAKAILLNWDHIHDEQLMIQDDSQVTQIPRHGIDIILGSELTYTGNENTINNLIQVIDLYLKPFGVFIEVLSDDRDGVAQFLVDVNNHGYTSTIIPVHERYLGNFNTKQRSETYRFYVFVRKGEQENNELYQSVVSSMQ